MQRQLSEIAGPTRTNTLDDDDSVCDTCFYFNKETDALNGSCRRRPEFITRSIYDVCGEYIRSFPKMLERADQALHLAEARWGIVKAEEFFLEDVKTETTQAHTAVGDSTAEAATLVEKTQAVTTAQAALQSFIRVWELSAEELKAVTNEAGEPSDWVKAWDLSEAQLGALSSTSGLAAGIYVLKDDGTNFGIASGQLNSTSGLYEETANASLVSLTDTPTSSAAAQALMPAASYLPYDPSGKYGVKVKTGEQEAKLFPVTGSAGNYTLVDTGDGFAFVEGYDSVGNAQAALPASKEISDDISALHIALAITKEEEADAAQAKANKDALIAAALQAKTDAETAHTASGLLVTAAAADVANALKARNKAQAGLDRVSKTYSFAFVEPDEEVVAYPVSSTLFNTITGLATATEDKDYALIFSEDYDEVKLSELEDDSDGNPVFPATRVETSFDPIVTDMKTAIQIVEEDIIWPEAD